MDCFESLLLLSFVMSQFCVYHSHKQLLYSCFNSIGTCNKLETHIHGVFHEVMNYPEGSTDLFKADLESVRANEV